jgi:hypothetical protein
MDSFWINFSADFVATILGAIIGIPIALGINRRFIKDANRREEASNKVSLQNALGLIKESILFDKEIIRDIVNALNGSIADTAKIVSLGINYSMWEAVKGEIIEHSKDVELKINLTSYYYNAERLMYLKQVVEDFIFGIHVRENGALYAVRYKKLASDLGGQLIDEIDNLNKKIITIIGE